MRFLQEIYIYRYNYLKKGEYIYYEKVSQNCDNTNLLQITLLLKDWKKEYNSLNNPFKFD